MTAPETAVEVLEPEPAPPSPWPLAEETLAANTLLERIWTEPLSEPDLAVLAHLGEQVAACVPYWPSAADEALLVPATEDTQQDLLDAWFGQTSVSPDRWLAESRRARGLASHGPMSGYETPVPRFIPSDETASDLPAVGEDTEAMTRYLGLHDGRQGEPARESAFKRWFR